MKKKILVIGNYNDAIYHGLAGVDERLTSILSNYELICTDDTSKLLSLEEDQISGIISYLDIWQSKLCDDEALRESSSKTSSNSPSALPLRISIPSAMSEYPSS